MVTPAVGPSPVESGPPVVGLAVVSLAELEPVVVPAVVLEPGPVGGDG
ncbi:MAG: hypothetical protein KDK70_31620 [Myxococcales bacterium]|nr:hypothetical protein [Myxococcales bacterium]